MGDRRIDVVVQSRTDVPLLERTLGNLARQLQCRPRVFLIGCNLGDRATTIAARHGAQVLDGLPTRTSPGALMNLAMRETTSPVVAFINADAVPLSESSLASLLLHFDATPMLAAAFGRQVRRQASLTSLTRELLRAPAGLAPIREERCFSMAAAAVSRGAWYRHAFDERLRYAEDTDWATRVRRDGWATTCVASAPFEQSLDASLRRHFPRAGQPTPPPRSSRHDLGARRAALSAVMSAPPTLRSRVAP